MRQLPKPILLLGALVVTLGYLGVNVLAWGDWQSYFAHPARASMAVLLVVISLASLFTEVNLSTGKREDAQNRWIFVPIILLSIPMAFLPAYMDRRELWTIGGDGIRYLGLGLFVAGAILRMWPVFVLGRRFSGLVAIQEGHELMTKNVYRVIRHPSYLGALVFMLGWNLVYRSSIGVLLTLLMVPVFVARINAEEKLLASEFGEQYAAYRKRTWRMIPLVY